jgi:HEAT repeat protein
MRTINNVISLCFVLGCCLGCQSQKSETHPWDKGDAATAAEPVAERATQKTVEAWTAQLKEADPQGRWEAARALQELGPEAKVAIPALTEALQDQHDELRFQAVATLGAIGPEAKSAVPMLLQMLEDVRQSDSGVFVSRGRGYPFSDVEVSVCELIAQALIEIDSQAAQAEAIPTLAEVARTRDGDLRRDAALALGTIGRPAIPALQELVRHEDEARQRAAACGLGKLGAEALTVLKDLPAKTRFTVAVALEELKEDGIATLLELLRDDDPTVRRAAAVALGNIVARLPRGKLASPPRIPPVAKPIIELLRDRDADVRWAAVQALGTMKMPEAVTPLIELLDEQDATIRRDAATALGRIGSMAQRAIPALKALLQDRDANVARAADEALQKIESATNVSSNTSGAVMDSAAPSDPYGPLPDGGYKYNPYFGAQGVPFDSGTNQSVVPPWTTPGSGLQPGQPHRPIFVPPPVVRPRTTPRPPVGRR